MTDPRRTLPSVHALLTSDATRPLLDRAPRRLVTDAVREAIDRVRRNPATTPRDDREWAAAVERALSERERSSLRTVFNATGVVLHTNLGRAPLAAAAVAAVARVATGYSSLEYDLARGGRGSRYAHCAPLLVELTGAEDALVVNNGAAALILALNTLAQGREAIVSRGELIEIGGSFRIPDIMAKSGAELVEVGTTNRTHPEDYARAVGPRTGALVKVHRSNFALDGFVADVDLPALAALGAERSVPVLFDLGSGQLMSLEAAGLRGEPTAPDAIREGASVVVMSGDKLLGGPQAGIILGRTSVIAEIRRNPLTRAFRVDKLTLAALEATLALYRDPAAAMREIPTLAMLSASVEALAARAAATRQELARAGVSGTVVASEGAVGGGAYATARLPSAAIALYGDAEALDAALRATFPPVVGRIHEGRLLLDFRSVPAGDDEPLARAVIAALA